MRAHALVISTALLTLVTVGQAKPSIVVSFQPYYSITRTIAGPDATVTQLVPAGADPHHFEPKPSDIRHVSKANLILLNGLGLDEWIERLARNSGTKARLVPLGETIKFNALESAEHGEHDETHATDPHIWLDASIMAKAATVIGEQLATINPGRAQAYRSRARQEHTKLMALHGEIKTKLAPVRNVPVVTFHGAWAYWSRAYGPKIAAVVEPFPGKEPSAKYVREVVSLLKQQRARAVFAEPQLPIGPAQVIAESAGTRVHVITPEGSAKHADYYAMMRANASTFLNALK